MNSTIALLSKCAKYYFSLKLVPDCYGRKFLCKAPKECVNHDAIYNILNFLTATDFISQNVSILKFYFKLISLLLISFIKNYAVS